MLLDGSGPVTGPVLYAVPQQQRAIFKTTTRLWSCPPPDISTLGFLLGCYLYHSHKMEAIARNALRMSTSPFADFTQSTLTFKIDDGVPVLDETGNYAAPSRTITVKAFLEQSKRQGKAESTIGELRNLVHVEGHCVEPMQMPPELEPGMSAIATVNGVDGRFVLSLVLPDPVSAAGEAVGDQIKGTFEVTGNRGNFA